MARLTGLEPATPGVTGRYSNQLSYNRSLPPASGRDAVSMVSALPRQALSRGFLKQKFCAGIDASNALVRCLIPDTDKG